MLKYSIQGDPKRLSIVISLWQVSNSQKWQKPTILEMVHREVLIFRCLESVRRKHSRLLMLYQIWLVCLQPDWIPQGMSPQTHPLNTTETLKLIETYIVFGYTDISVYPKTITKPPIHLQGGIRRKQTPTDTWDSFLHVWFRVNLEPNHYFGKTLKGKIAFTWHCWDIKLSKPPNVPFPKIVEFCHF